MSTKKPRGEDRGHQLESGSGVGERPVAVSQEVVGDAAHAVDAAAEVGVEVAAALECPVEHRQRVVEPALFHQQVAESLEVVATAARATGERTPESSMRLEYDRGTLLR